MSVAGPGSEICRREPAVSLSWFADRRNWYGDRSGSWKLAGACTAAVESYYVLLRDFDARPDQWRAHLSEKAWFSRDDFEAAVSRRTTTPPWRPRKGRRAARYRANLKPRPVPR